MSQLVQRISILVSGSRGLSDSIIKQILDYHFANYHAKLLNGDAAGVDKIAAEWANSRGIPVSYFRPDWSKGRGAGIQRNSQMIELADVVCVFWDGKSPGTLDVIKKTRKSGKELIVWTKTKDSNWDLTSWTNYSMNNG